jgi:hypothetical protein
MAPARGPRQGQSRCCRLSQEENVLCRATRPARRLHGGHGGGAIRPPWRRPTSRGPRHGHRSANVPAASAAPPQAPSPTRGRRGCRLSRPCSPWRAGRVCETDQGVLGAGGGSRTLDPPYTMRQPQRARGSARFTGTPGGPRSVKRVGTQTPRIKAFWRGAFHGRAIRRPCETRNEVRGRAGRASRILAFRQRTAACAEGAILPATTTSARSPAPRAVRLIRLSP